MARILHILTRPDDSLAKDVIARQKESQSNFVEIADLTKANPDYEHLLELIFASDAVESW